MNENTLNEIYAKLCKATFDCQRELQAKVDRYELPANVARIEAAGFNKAMKIAVELLYDAANVTCAIERGKRIV